MIHTARVTASIADMPFKIFQKRETPSSPASLSSKLVPATPKMKIGEFSLKPPVTPTLTDASLRGEQKRTGILEAQLKEVSLTASKAYDQVEDLTLRNQMLQDQVLQQKQLIESFTKQLEDAARVRQELKSLQESDMRKMIRERSQESDVVSRLTHDKESLQQELASMKEEVLKCKDIICEKEMLLQKVRTQYQREIQEKNAQLEIAQAKPQVILKRAASEVVNEDESRYRGIVDTQKKKIAELEAELEMKTNEYERTLGEMKNTMLVLKNSQMFLSKQGYSSPLLRDGCFGDVTIDREGGASGGDTFVLSNLSFLP